MTTSTTTLQDELPAMRQRLLVLREERDRSLRAVESAQQQLARCLEHHRALEGSCLALEARLFEAIDQEVAEADADERPLPFPQFRVGKRTFSIYAPSADPSLRLAVVHYPSGRRDHRGLGREIIETLADAGGEPVDTGRLVAAVGHLAGSPNAVRLRLTRMVEAGEVFRPRRGFYRLPTPQELGFDAEGRELAV